MKTAALIVAAGRGERARQIAAGPKQYATVGGRSVLALSVGAFSDHPGIDAVQVVIHEDDAVLYAGAGLQGAGKLLAPATGGATRQASVRLGLEALAREGAKIGGWGRVLIHDAARPFVDRAVIDRVLAALETADGAIAALAVSDTLKRSDSENAITGTLDRSGLWQAQTPQGFAFPTLLEAHRQAEREAFLEATDDAQIAEWAGLRVVLVEGSARNLKLTTGEQIAMAQRDAADNAWPAPRVGTGFDVHKFGPGDHLWLCGVKVAHTHTLIGHSDADVGLHALTDALFGAIGDGDIGSHFPPTDPQWKGASSDIFLKHAVERVRAFPASISNVDVTLICEEPKIGPHREAMRAQIARLLDLPVGRVSVKATTTEQLGFTGRREGIGAIATVTVLSTA